MKIRSVGLGAVLAAGLMGSTAQAAVAVYELPFIGDWVGYSTPDIGRTFTGDGFVGMYRTEFGALLGLEGRDYSRTHAQVGIGDLIGASITSAVLSFDLKEGSSSDFTLHVTGYAGTGELGFQWEAPDENFGSILGTGTGTGAGAGHNAVDITSLLLSALAEGEAWLNLHLQGDGNAAHWTYTGSGYDLDRAQMRLTVNYDSAPLPAEVPAPGALGLMLMGLAGLGFARGRDGRRG